MQLPPAVMPWDPGSPEHELISRLHAISERQIRSPSFRLHSLGRRLRGALGGRGTNWDDPRLRAYLRDKLVALEADKCRLSYLLARAANATRIVEVGTSFGVSTLYLAAAVRDNAPGGQRSGLVIGSENEPAKAAQARANLAEAGLAGWAEIREGDFRMTLRDVPGPVDFVLMDIWAPLARPAIELLAPRLRSGGLVVCDNIVAAHREYRDYLAFIRDPANGFGSATLPFKGGLELSVRLPDALGG